MQQDGGLTALETLVSAKRHEWETLQRDKRRIDTLFERCKEYITNLNKILELEGLPIVPLDDVGADSRAFAAVGNKSPDMPTRRPEFEATSLPKAIESILNASLKPMHADSIVERIFEVHTREDVRRAKRSVVSTLAGGAKNGHWRRVGANTFAANTLAVLSNAGAAENR